jgi:DNA-binding MarR family transcriptional regulator
VAKEAGVAKHDRVAKEAMVAKHDRVAKVDRVAKEEERVATEGAPGGSGADRPDLGAMAVRLGRRLIALEQPILARHEISMWAYIVLTALRDRPMRTQAALAASIGADKTRLIPVLDDLQRRALIEREPDPADRRVRLLGLTADGRRLHRAVQTEIRAAEDLLLAELPGDDRAAFLRGLRTLSRADQDS